jgi:hypothetical protein
MAKTIPFRQSPQAARARKNRTLLLPLPQATSDELALRAHIALDAMRRGQGSVHAAQALTQAMILAGYLAEAGYGEATFEQMRQAESDISVAFDRGRDTGDWRLDGDAAGRFAVIVWTYDRQLRRAPLAAIVSAREQLDRFQAGGPPASVVRKRG